MLLTTKITRLLAILLLLMSVLAVACSPASGDGAGVEEMEHNDEAAHDDGHTHDGEHSDRIPNPGGAAVTILAPADGATFTVSDEVLVEVNVENFDLAVDGNHWHVYIDGSSWGMVTGGNTDQPLRGLEPGMHEISVYIAGGDHIEFQDGDSIMITVGE